MVTISNDVLTVEIDEKGGQLTSVRSNETGIEYMWQGDPKYWTSHAPNLFPFVGRLYQGQYTYQGQTYEMACHGFLRPSVMTVAKQSTDAVTLELHESDETLAIWPFRFTLTLRYALEGDCLDITTTVRNDGEETLYYGNGGHPGFNVPLDEGLAFEDYVLEFPQAFDARQVQFDESVLDSGERTPYELVDGKILPLRHELFGFDAVVFEDMPREVTLHSEKGTHGVTASFPEMRYVGFWHKPRTDAPYVCIEPWAVLPGRSGVIEDLTTMPGLAAVAPGETSSNPWSLRFF